MKGEEYESENENEFGKSAASMTEAAAVAVVVK